MPKLSEIKMENQWDLVLLSLRAAIKLSKL